MSHRIGKNVLAGLVVLVLGTSALGVEEKLITDGLTFYAGFDKSLEPDNCVGARLPQGSYEGTPGKVGQALTGKTATVSYGCSANFYRSRGSVSFWINPVAAFASLGPAYVLFDTTLTSSIRLVYVKDKQVFFFITGGTPPGRDWTYDYSLAVPVDRIPPNTWTNVVMTWDKNISSRGGSTFLSHGETRKGQKKIYLNGELAGTSQVADIGGNDEGTFILGGDLPGRFDELMIWDRVLAPEDVKALFTKPQEVAKTMKALPPLSVKKVWRVYPELVYRQYNNSLVSPGEAFTFDAPIVNRTDTPQTGKLVLSLLNLWEKPVGTPLTFTFKLAPEARTTFPASYKLGKLGLFKVRATVVIGDREDSRDITSFGCVPPGNPPKHPFFGCHIQQISDAQTGQARRLGFSANRCHDQNQYTWWRSMEFEPGKWIMNQKESHFDRLNKFGVDHWGEWFATPNWAVTLKDGRHPDAVPLNVYPRGWMPTDMAAYRNYIRESIRRFPKIKEWEVWNEPWISYFFEGSIEDYVELCRAAYETAKAIDPTLRVYACLETGLWSRAVLKKGVLKYVDGVAYHGYLAATSPWDQALKDARAMRKLLREFSDKDIPLVNSEGGLSGTTFLRGLDFEALPPENKRQPLNFITAAERIVQYYVTQMAEGIGHWFYYFHGDIGEENSYSFYSTLEVTFAPKPAAVAICMLVWQLDGGKFLSAGEREGGLHFYVFDRQDGGSVAVLWTIDGGEVDLTWSGDIYDVMGNRVDPKGTVRVAGMPMYFRHSGKAGELAGRLNAAKLTVVKAPEQPKVVATSSKVPQPKKMMDFTVAIECGESRLIPLDLKAVVNQAFADDRAGDGKGGWTDEGPFNDLRDMKPGLHQWLGVPVKVLDPAENGGRAVLTMRGRTFQGGPTRSGPIAVGRKVRGLFFTHAANYAQAAGTEAGAYEVEYLDGSRQTIPIILGTNVWDWWWDHREGEDSRTIPVKVSQSLVADCPYRFIRLWYWENPKPNQPIKSITLSVPKSGDPAIVLIGITAAVWEK